ncbi:ABC transporter permease [Bacillus thuringiensis]|uniref:Permease n=1 Tax=Bacillus thuringiensis subsp. jegathesan TaxID=56955 RepID=A0A9X6M097_BACTJ|nr:ABC transporter permease [Bacillus thuringiensis]MDM5370312.1 ABC transporter permease [Bacillus bombysepticus]OUB59028.1 permease [Bacillus thuringiensis serovar jegathesan]
MRKILIEVKESLLKKKMLSILILLQTCLLFALLSALYLSFYNIDTKTKSFYAQYKGKNIYKLSDRLIDEKEARFFSNPSELSKVKNFYHALLNSKDFLYMNTTLQHIGVQNFKGNPIFLQGYEQGNPRPPYQKRQGSPSFDRVKSIQINHNLLTAFDAKIQNGRVFNKEDFSFKKGTKIPIILGAEYQSIYNIGETINFDYLNQELEGIIIGILQKNTLFPVNGDVEFYVDRYIILPEFIMEEVPQNEEVLRFQQKHYLHAINGQILTNKDMISVQKLVNSISQKANFDDYIIIGANTIGISLMFTMMKQNIQIMFMFTVVIFLFCIFSISLSLIMKWDTNIKKYAIHLISGATVSQILWYTFIEILFVIGISLTLIFLFMQFVGEMPISYYFILIGVSLIIVVLGMLPFSFKLKQSNIVKILKKKE